MFADAYFDSLDEALDELHQRRSDPASQGILSRMEKSPYGGYRVWSITAEMYAEMLVDGIDIPTHQKRKPDYAA